MPRTKMVNGIEVPFTPEEEIARDLEEQEVAQERARYIREEQYKDLRRKEYPPVQEQLDALYHAMDSGNLPQIQGFYDELRAIKEKYPKPTSR